MDVDAILERVTLLDVPPILPNQAIGPGEPGCCPAGIRDGLFRDGDAAPIRGDIAHVMNRVLEIRQGPGGHLTTGVQHLGAHLAEVCTSYLCANMAQAGALPMMWETMLVVDEDIVLTWRYATRAAAHQGHRRIVEALGLDESAGSLESPRAPDRIS